jgi:hypothetical protein
MIVSVFKGGRPVVGFGFALGDVERRNPLPVGRYWVDVFNSKEAAFREWLQAHKADVRVLTTETFEPVGDYEGRVWRLFEVLSPVTWEGPGLPTVADPGVKSSADTAQRPAPEKDPLDQIDPKISDLTDAAARLTKTIAIVGVVAAVVVGGVLIVYYRPRRAVSPAALPEPSPP